MASHRIAIDTASKGLLDVESGGELRLSMMYAELVELDLSFAPGDLSTGDCITVTVDDDTVFYDASTPSSNPPVMASATHTVTAQEAADGAASVSFSTRTDKFRDAVNGRGAAGCTLSIVKWTGEDGTDATLLGESPSCTATALPSERLS